MKITNETVHAALDETLSGVSLSEWDKQRIVYNALQAQPKKSCGKRRLRRVYMMAAAFAMVCALGVTALAVPDLAQKLGMLSRQTLSYLRPVEKETVAGDVRAEVVAAMNDGDTAVVYVSLQDLSGKNRLDDTITTGGAILEGMDSVSRDNIYQKDDGTVVLRLVGQSDSADLSGKKLTLDLDTLLSQNHYVSMQDTGFTVADVQKENPAPAVSGTLPNTSYTLNGDIGSPLYQKLESGLLPALQTDGPFTDDGVSWAKVRNAGVVGGLLHILQELDPDRWYNSVEYVLGDAQGNAYDTATASVPYGEQDGADSNPWGVDNRYTETLLELPEDTDPAEMHIYRNLDTYDVCIPAHWKVSFTLQAASPAVVAACDVDMGTWRLTGVSASSIGVTLTGRGVMDEDMNAPEVVLTMADGSEVKEESSWSSSMSMVQADGSISDKEGQIIHKYLFAEPLAQDDIRTVTVGGTVVWQWEADKEA